MNRRLSNRYRGGKDVTDEKAGTGDLEAKDVGAQPMMVIEQLEELGGTTAEIKEDLRFINWHVARMSERLGALEAAVASLKGTAKK
jgi:hypothetical protein